jgi:hypothetical protein
VGTNTPEKIDNMPAVSKKGNDIRQKDEDNPHDHKDTENQLYNSQVEIK